MAIFDKDVSRSVGANVSVIALLSENLYYNVWLQNHGFFNKWVQLNLVSQTYALVEVWIYKHMNYASELYWR